MSITECCLRNTVETDISSATTKNDALTRGCLSFSQCQEAKHTAKEPSTCIDGHTLVFVSNAYSPDTIRENMSFPVTSGRRF